MEKAAKKLIKLTESLINWIGNPAKEKIAAGANNLRVIDWANWIDCCFVDN